MNLDKSFHGRDEILDRELEVITSIKAKAKNDWYSLLLCELITRGLEKGE